MTHTGQSPRVPRDVQDLLDGRDSACSPSPGLPKKEDEIMERELRRYKAKMSLLERCRWSLRGKDHIRGLIKNLRRYNDDLIRLCTWEDQLQINRGFPTFVLPQSKNFMDLHFIANSAEEAAKDKTSPMAEGRQMTAVMARFKAKVMTPSKISDKYQASWRRLDQKDYNVLSTSNPWSLGISLGSQNPVFVEWQSYLDENRRPNELAEQQIHRLGDLLSVSSRPKEFRALDCIGLFKDKANDRYGVVYHLPVHLRSLPARVRSNSRRIYNPSTLTDLIGFDGVTDLGIRFELAKKLMYSVVIMHTCGWLHKNICSDNVLFFPARPADGEKVQNYRKDIGRPIIVGYGLSRPDDVDISRGMEGPNNFSMQPGQDEKSSLNIYQHPDKAANPDRRFRHSYDIYSLGLILLEIGLWQSLQTFDTNRWRDAYAFRKFILDRLVPDLWGQCGSIYGGVVKECLTISSSALTLAEEGQRMVAWSIAQRLEKCVA